MGHALTNERTKVIEGMKQHGFHLHRATTRNVKAALGTGMVTDPEGNPDRM
jgi:hypothetical protein